MHDEEIVARALSILERRIRDPDVTFTCSNDIRSFLRLKMGEYEREVVAIIFLDHRHRLIDIEELFYGTIDGARVHVREIARRALQLNSAALVMVHNHPSGVSDPSVSDESLTRQVKECLQQLDIRLLDHIVVTAGEAVSMAERGKV